MPKSTVLVMMMAMVSFYSSDHGGPTAAAQPASEVVEVVTTPAPAPTPAGPLDRVMPLLAEIESGGVADPYSATNPESSATGKYQIILSTALYASRNLEPNVREWAEPALRGFYQKRDRAGYQEWLSAHPGLQEQLAFAYLQDIKQVIKRRGLPITPLHIAIAWQYPCDPGGTTDLGAARAETVERVMHRMSKGTMVAFGP